MNKLYVDVAGDFTFLNKTKFDFNFGDRTFKTIFVFERVNLPAEQHLKLVKFLA